MLAVKTLHALEKVIGLFLANCFIDEMTVDELILV
jgi:hypothetical protein